MQEQTEKKSFDLYAESKEFAFRSIKLYQYLTESKEKKEYSLAKQYLLAGTRIGDFVRQENLLEAYHSAKSAKYWLELLQSGGYLNNEEAESMINDCLPLVKILYVRTHPDSRKASAPVPEASASGYKKGGAR